MGKEKMERPSIRLTKTEVEALVPKEKDYFISVDGHDGLCIRVLPSGERSFVLRYRFNGIQRKHLLGRYPAMPISDVRKAHVRASRGGEAELG